MDFAFGGSGGGGGHGGKVAVHNQADILTYGEDATGIQAYSIGGGGGTAGGAGTTTNLLGVKLNIATSLALGGKSQAAGNGGNVSVSHTASVVTEGGYAAGIEAVSIGGGGGGGGRGGMASTSTAVGVQQSDQLNDIAHLFALADAFTVNTALGGAGGAGGKGGDVDVRVAGEIVTLGANASGIVAQSVGGGGGRAGGFNGGGTGTLSSQTSLGGSGGQGGDGGSVKVHVERASDIYTVAAGSHAVFAQSVGGGGGMGGSYTGKVAGVPELTLALVPRLFGELGKYYKLKPEFETKLKEAERAAEKKEPGGIMRAYQIFTELLTGLRAEMVGLGGDNSEEGNERNRMLEALKAWEFYLNIQLAQNRLGEQIKSINDDLKAEKVSLPNAELKVSLGGSGGRGGHGGKVTASNAGKLTTEDDHSHGMMAQSVGGGGGAGGAAYSTGSNQINATVALGGSGAVGGHGGQVVLDNTGAVSTSGKLSYGLFAQSVGGGGGVGGASATADTISLSADVTLGGNASVAARGGDVVVNQNGTVLTLGDQSHGVVAQSVGGGGGTFFLSPANPLNREAFTKAGVTADLDAAEKKLYAALAALFDTLDIQQGGSVNINQHHTLLPSPTLAVKMGGDGGGGGAGGNVTLAHTGEIETYGRNAHGILAQSVGGGGGMGGTTGTGALPLTTQVSLGGVAGAGGDGGKVELQLGEQSRIDTHGSGAVGVLLQSVGGGGGYAGGWSFSPDEKSNFTFERGEVAAGRGGDINVTSPHTGRYTIHTRGSRAHGMVAQSVGGGGGLMADAHGLIIHEAKASDQKRGKARGAGGAISIDTHGHIFAEGEHAYGILAQSGVQTATGSLDPDREGGNIRIFHHGVVSGGSGDGAAIFIDGGRDNILTIRHGSYLSALSGTAIKGSFGNDTVRNSGVVLGKVDLVGNVPAKYGTNHFHNGSDGALSLLGMRLGAGGRLLNEGVMSVGQPGQPTRVELDGDFEQGRTGQLLIDVSPSAGPGELVSDYLKVSGSVALDGVIWSDSVTALLPGSYPFLEAGTTLQLGNLITAGTWRPHVPIGWTVARQDNRLSLVPQANFAGVQGITLSDNQREVAAHLQEAWDAGREPHAGVFARLLETGSAQDYARTLDSLGPETLQASAVTRLHASRIALKSVMSCPAFADNGTWMREGDCAWGRITHRLIDQGASGHGLGYRVNATSFQLGMQREWKPGWFVGMSAAYTDARLRGDGNLLRSTGDSADLAFALKREIGNWTLAGSLAAGYGRFDNRRSLYVGNQVLQASSRSDVYTVAGKLRAAYQFNGARSYVSPRVDLDVVHTRKPGYTEHGAGSLNLEVSTMRETTLALRPAIEVGGRYDLKSGGWVRPYANVGLTIMSDDALTTRANFVGNGSGSRDFTTSSRVAPVLGDVGVGVQMKLNKRYEVSAEYQAQLGRHYTAHQGMARLSIRF